MTAEGMQKAGGAAFALSGALLLSALTFAFTVSGQLHLLVGASVFFALVLISMRHPDKMLLVLVAVSILLPLDVAVKAGTLPRIGPTRAMMAAILLGMLARRVLTRPEHREPVWLPFLVPAALFLTTSLVSALQSVSVAVSLNAVVGRILLESFILFYILLHYLKEPGFWPALRATLYAATALVCLFAFVEFLAQSNPLVGFYSGERLEFRAGLPRCRSTFVHPIALGCYLNIILPILLADLVTSMHRGRRTLLLALLGMMAVTMLLTVSRVPWILFAATIVGFSLLHRPNWRRIGLTAASLLLVAMGFALLYANNGTLRDMFRPFVAPGSVAEDQSANYRLVLIRSVMRHIDASRFAFGYGPNAFHLAGVTAIYSDHARVLTAPDLHYVRLVLEHGAVGLLTFLAMLGLLIRGCVGFLRHARQEHGPIILGCLLGLIVFALENTTVSMFNLYPLGMLFWMLAAIAFHFGESRRPATRSESA